ncbi:MAG: UDP-glucose 4-epimerase GalE [Alphaproteobacteria bacterium]|nr:UDP-glucose 4-epimerase GalE [Alphaproteobacteria bacterium]
MRAALVTGGAGYIGSHACKALARSGWHPVSYDDLSLGHRALVKWGPLEEGDIRDRARLDAVFARWRPQAVLHFAALSQVGASVRQPDLYCDVNVAGTECLLGAMQTAGVDTLVFSSTAAVYGVPAHLPITETTPVAPTNPYGETKVAAEAAIRRAAESGKLRYAILRYFNAAGGDPDGETGESHEPETHLIPNALAAALGKAPALELFGDDYPTPDGTCIRDYIHVSDVAEAHVLALSRLAESPAPVVCDLGTGKGVSVREIVAAIEAVTGRAVPIRKAPRRPGDPPVLYTAAQSAQRELDWRPERSDLTSIIRDALIWQTSCKPT